MVDVVLIGDKVKDDCLKFITFAWVDDKKEKHILQWDFPEQFKEYIKDKQVNEVYELFIVGQPIGTRTMEKAYALMNG